MKTITATFSSSDAAQKAIDALVEAGIPELDIASDTVENDDTVVEARVDEGKADAAAAILRAGSIDANERESDAGLPVVDQPNVAGHPDGPRPVITPVAPNR